MNCVLHVWVLAQSRAKKYCHIPIFKNHSWQKSPNPAYFIMKTPLYCLTPFFFQILSNLPSPVAANPYPHCSFCCLVFLTKWVIAPHLMCYFAEWYYGSTHIKPWYLSTRRTLMCVLCNKASSLLRSDTCDFLLALWWYHTHTNTQTHSTFRGQ